MNTTRLILTSLAVVLTLTVVPCSPVEITVESPEITVKSASREQRDRTTQALGLFAAAGLELPTMEIEYFDAVAGCRGYAGLYVPATENGPSDVDQILMCNEHLLILLHELAHAWKQHNLTDNTKIEFMEHWGLERWNDKSDDHLDRAVERAAHTIAFTLNHEGSDPSDGVKRYICDYELLTGTTLPIHDVIRCA